jgi:hypothetical protein
VVRIGATAVPEGKGIWKDGKKEERNEGKPCKKAASAALVSSEEL